MFNVQTFKLWKKQADETLKERAQEEKRRKQEEEEAKKEKERVKRESAEASFCAWKKKKDSELKKKMMEDRLVLVLHMLTNQYFSMCRMCLTIKRHYFNFIQECRYSYICIKM